jgi:hypothetical protein
MNTFSVTIHKHLDLHTSAARVQLPAMAHSIREILALLGAATAAVAVIMISVWLTGLEISNILGAGTWGAAFVFLALAVDAHKLTAILQGVTGVALLVLAWLQKTVSPDYMIVSGVVIAIWIAVVVFRRL